MRRLDRYLLREQIISLLMGLTFFVAIFIVVDVFQKLDSFLDNKVPLLLVVHFYIVSIPSIVTTVLPMSMLLSCLLALGQIGRHNELTAMQAAGIGLTRIVLPLYVFALLVSAAVFVTNETLLPKLNAERNRIYKGDIKRENLEGASVRTNLAYLGTDGRTFLIRAYNIPEKTMREVVIQEIRQHTLNGRIDAESAAWVKGHWVFHEGFIRRFDRDGEHAAHFNELVIPGLQEVPESFAKAEEEPEALSYWELQKYIQRLRQSGSRVQKYVVDLDLKVSFPLTNLIVVLIGTALAIRVRRGGLAISFGLAVFISFVYYALIRIGQAFGHSGTLPPFLGAWLGNIVFGGLGLELLRRARRGL
ncbi:MAG TPA: LptF/LptG family permease [Candidatus Angelobacter sp.]|nr:LptF/LptG family permease [Candidatus Angelobacter sp.]